MENRRTFYLDNRNGNDAASGLSEREAWKSLERVNVQTFLPGDSIMLKCGGEWTGMLAPKGSGSRYAPIRLISYGEGEMPVIHGNGSYAAVLLDSVSFWHVKGIRVTNRAEERGVRQGICICGSAQGITEGITIEACEISEVHGENRRSRDVYQSMYWNSGIYVTMPGRSSDQDHLHDIVIRNNYVHDVLTSGIRVNQQEDFINDIHHTHVVVRGNRIERTGSDGIIVANCISPLIDGNRCFDAGALGSLEDTKLIAGVWVCATKNALIQRNEVANTRLFENDGTAFDTDWGTAGDTIFQYNFTHGNKGGFWLDCMGINRNRECGKTILRYNLSLDDERCLVQDDYGLPGELYGNVFIHTTDALLICCHKGGESHTFLKMFSALQKILQMDGRSHIFYKNQYIGITNLPEEDTNAGTEMSELIREILADMPQRKEDCDAYWGRIASLVETIG